MGANRFTGLKAFYAIIVGQIISSVGSGMTRFGVGIWVFTETQDAAAYSTLLFFAVLPLGLGSLIAGPLVDRLDRKRVMVIANVVASLSTLVIAVLYFADALALWHLYVALAVNGVANAFIQPAIDSSVPLMVPKAQLGRAAGLTQLIKAMETVLAPAIAGVVFGFFGLGAIFVLDFVTFTASIIGLLLALVPQPPPSDTQTNLWQDFMIGIRTVLDRPAFSYLMGFSVVTGFLLGGLGYGLVTPLVLSFSTEEVAGLVVSAFGLGALIGGIGLTAWGGPVRRMHGLLGATALAGVGMIAVGWRENALMVGLAFLLVGINFIFILGMPRVIFQTKASPAVLGRIFSLRTALALTTQSLGILLAGTLAERFFEPLLAVDGPLAGSVGQVIGVGDGRGMALLFILAGIGLLIVSGVSALLPAVRLLEDRVPDYHPDGKPKRDRDIDPAISSA